jgi:hypothetical protein
MDVETTPNETAVTETDRAAEAASPHGEWVTPEYTEQSTCAEICAYVFSA